MMGIYIHVILSNHHSLSETPQCHSCMYADLHPRNRLSIPVGFFDQEDHTCAEMVDSSPQAKVQELKALFSRKNNPVMGILSAQSSLKHIQNSESKASYDAKKFSPSNNVHTSSQPERLIENTVSIGPTNTYTTVTTNDSTSSTSSDSGLELSPAALNKPKVCGGTKTSLFIKHTKSLSSSSVGVTDNKTANTTCEVKSTKPLTTQSKESISLEHTEEMDKQKKTNDFSKVVTQEREVTGQVNPTLPLVSFTVKPLKERNGSTVERIKQAMFVIHSVIHVL
ncbi:uncharacterized protein LOC143245221 isoform X4 [Tachypleus tridentatus]|uniref:uncharacterized protein LOC143245221 isoform X4 n=1 Tax=Tachypleus tridentatus TaxID=6853 RepID=UPI003FD4CF05